MNVENMIAARVSEEFLKHLEIASSSIVLTKQEFMKAVGDAYLRGLDKGVDLGKCQAVKVIRDTPKWPSRSDRMKVADWILDSDHNTPKDSK